MTPTVMLPRLSLANSAAARESMPGKVGARRAASPCALASPVMPCESHGATQQSATNGVHGRRLTGWCFLFHHRNGPSVSAHVVAARDRVPAEPGNGGTPILIEIAPRTWGP